MPQPYVASTLLTRGPFAAVFQVVASVVVVVVASWPLVVPRNSGSGGPAGASGGVQGGSATRAPSSGAGNGGPVPTLVWT